MLWLRGAMFTILLPFTVGIYIPQRLAAESSPEHGPWSAGWLLIAAGAVLYGWSLARFLLAGGTPAIFFLRGLQPVVGKEPPGLVRGGPYRVSRNPMYLAMALAVFGQALLYRSAAMLVYGVAVVVVFHLTVVLLEEPHLRRKCGAAYTEYERNVPRWIGVPRR